MSTTDRPATPAVPRAPDRPPAGGPPRRGHRAMLWFFGFIIAMAAVAFAFKFYEFFVDLARQEGFRFAGAHLLTYLLVAGGFFLLLAFAFLSGHFADIERPKYDLLDSERRHDEADFD